MIFNQIILYWAFILKVWRVTSDLCGVITVSSCLPQHLLHVAQLLPQSLHLIHQSRLLVVKLSVGNHRFTVLFLRLRQRVLNAPQTDTVQRALNAPQSQVINMVVVWTWTGLTPQVQHWIQFLSLLLTNLDFSDGRLRFHGEGRVTASSAGRGSSQRGECGGWQRGRRPWALRGRAATPSSPQLIFIIFTNSQFNFSNLIHSVTSSEWDFNLKRFTETKIKNQLKSNDHN